MATKTGRMVNYLQISYSWSYLALWLHGYAKSRDKLKSLYLHNHSAYDHQIWQYGDLLWETLIDKVTWPLDLVVLQDHVKSLNHYISSSVANMATKLGRMVTYFESLLSIKSYDPLLKWSGEIAWQTKNIIFVPLQFKIWYFYQYNQKVQKSFIVMKFLYFWIILYLMFCYISRTNPWNKKNDFFFILWSTLAQPTKKFINSFVVTKFFIFLNFFGLCSDLLSW